MLAANSTAQWFNGYMRHLLFLPEQGSSYAKDVDYLHYFVIGTTMVVSFLIALAAFVFLVRYKQRAPGTRGKAVSSGPILEAFFIGVPLSFFLLWFGLGFHVYMKLESPPQNAMDIYVLAKQWMWKFNYPDGPIAQSTLHVPVGRPVRLLMTSRDVIHSFYVPAFRVKRDVLPGRYTEVWFQAEAPGVYDLFCAEYCGTNHSYMRGTIVAMPPDAFDRWLAQQKRGREEQIDASTPVSDKVRYQPGNLAREGERVAAEKGCLKCHSIDGAPHIGPTWRGLYGRVERLSDGSSVHVDESYMTESMMAPAAKVVAGFQPVMPSYQGQLSPADVAAILEYIKSLRDPQLESRPSEKPIYGPQ